MKLFSTIAAFLIACMGASAQWFCTEEGTIFTYKDTDLKENKESVTTLTVQSVEKSDNGNIKTRLEEKQQIPAAFGTKEIVSFCGFTYNADTKETVFNILSADDAKKTMIDMISFAYDEAGYTLSSDQIDQMNKAMKVTGEINLPLPAEPVDGATFSKSTLRCRVETQTSTFSLNKGVYGGIESITTPAGTFDCLKVEYQFKRAVGGDVDTQIHTDYFAEGIGLVKSTQSTSKGEALSESVLESITK